ncbi:MAG: bifunctional diaminohydroxyphosphoribosylaminopyrimidine deaminase/5-amino-6-(5-phosphoribosylamino)uracil reductase RibD [Candidatus Micrarchaeota archaeon]
MEPMELALLLAKKANPYPNPRVGAVIVKGKEIIGSGYHRKAGTPHAEVEAILDAEKNGADVKGATLYVSLEPCSHHSKRTPPCTELIIEKKISKVVYGMSDPNPLVSSRKVLQKAGIIVKGPVAEEKGRAMNKRYLENISKKPFVAIKMAMSADGKSATKTGDSKWISCAKSREFVARLRADYDAVMVGARTVIKDNPRLTARIPGAKNPIRVIVDGKLKIPLNSKVVQNGTIIVITKQASLKKINAIKAAGADVFVCGEDRIDLKALIRSLSAMGIKKILIEGGSELNAGAVEAGIVDKFYIFVAPKIIGGVDAPGIIGGSGINDMKKARKVRGMKAKMIGADILIEFKV